MNFGELPPFWHFIDTYKSGIIYVYISYIYSFVFSSLRLPWTSFYITTRIRIWLVHYNSLAFFLFSEDCYWLELSNVFFLFQLNCLLELSSECTDLWLVINMISTLPSHHSTVLWYIICLTVRAIRASHSSWPQMGFVHELVYVGVDLGQPMLTAHQWCSVLLIC